MGAGFHGGFVHTKGKEQEYEKQSLPQNEAQLKHIFSGKTGHLRDTPANRKLITDLANNRKKFVGIDKYGNSWNVEVNRQGKQNWVRYRNGIINEGGQNEKAREWDNGTGFNKNPFKGGKDK